MKRKSSIPEEKLLPYETICAATRGDPDAITEVLRHFDGYISYQATRIFYDEYGQSYRGVDAELKQRIQDKLVARIMERFKPEYFSHSPGAGIWRPLHLPVPGHFMHHRINYVVTDEGIPSAQCIGLHLLPAHSEVPK